nr:ABC transporter permease [Actinomyces sp.]
MNIATGIITPWMFMSLYLLPRLNKVSESDVTASVTASMVGALWSASMWSAAGIIRREKWMGTLGSTLSSPLNPFLAILSKVVGAVAHDTALITVSVVSFCAAFRLPVRTSHPVLTLVSLMLVVVFGVAASSMIAGALIISRNPFHLTNLVGIPVLFLGGMVVPPSLLPAPLSWFSVTVNFYWLREFMNTLSSPAPAYHFLAAGTALSAAYLLLAYLAVRRLLALAKKEGSLALS